ncbi:MAG: GerMN domain-containing protein [Peptococcaceae bacterium]|jgi:hypothetical protein|nr:GerMN domain-containing protein [Peptococcaceae bacterium]
MRGRGIGSVILAAAMLWLTGCGVLQTLMPGEEKLAAQFGELKQSTVLSGGGSTSIGALTIALYFADQTGRYLVIEERAIPKTVSVARETVKQWLQGPASSDGSLKALTTPSATLLDIGIKEGIATVDLSEGFTEQAGNIPQELTVYGLVNTLTQFPTVNEVRVRINGREVSKVGDVDASRLVFKEGLLNGARDLPVNAPSRTMEELPVLSPSQTNLFSI